MQQFWKRAKPIFCAAAAAAVCLACFFVVWFHFLRGCETKSQSVYLNDSYDTQTAALQNGETTTQQFTTDSAVYGIGVVFQRLSPDVAGTLHLQLVDTTTGTVALEVTGNIATVIYDSYTGFLLDTPVTDASSHTWQLSVTPTYTQAENQLALAKSTAVVKGFGALRENGQAAGGSLALLATVEQLGTLPVKGYWALALVCAALAAGLALLCQKQNLGKAMLTFLAVLTLGLCYQFVLPAYAAPDEAIHYHTAYALSNRWLGLAPANPENNFIQRACDDDAVFSNYKTSPYTYRYLMQHLFDGAPAQAEYTESHVELMGGYKAPYVLSAAGITLARLLGFGGVGTAFFGRLWNLVFFAAMAALAVRLAPVGKGIFAAFALLPGCLHLGGSYSYDSCLLALAMVLTALCLQCALQEKPVRWQQTAGLCALCFFLAPLKAIYLPLCLFVFLIPSVRYAGRRSRLLTRLGAMGAAGVNFFAYNALTLYQVLRFSLHFASDAGADRISAIAAGTFPFAGAGVAAGSGLAAALTSAAVNPTSTYSLFYLLAHPGLLLKLLCNTFFPNAAAYASSFLGGTLGYLNLSEIRISGLILVGFLLMLLLACLPLRGEEKRLSGWQRILLLAVFLVVLGLVGMVCIYWTPSAYDYLWGFQGRYLLPLLPCLLLAIPFRRIQVEGDTFSTVLCGSFALELLTILNVLAVVYQR